MTPPQTQDWINTWLTRTDWKEATLSQPTKESAADIEIPTKIRVRPVQLKKGGLHAQFESMVGKQVFHENVVWSDVTGKISDWMKVFRQALITYHGGGSVHVTISPKGKVSLHLKDVTAFSDDGQTEQNAVIIPSHNREKKYLLQEGTPIPFLIELGVMRADGTVTAAMYHKFRQLNRYLEFVQDVLPELTNHLGDQEPIRIVDFGCGKSYLTFALYHYMKIQLGLNIEIIGLDLRKDVIQTATALAEKLGWSALHFQIGDIGKFEFQGNVNMVVSLHACDTATDAAIAKAARWRSNVIFAVPCCQHEVARQLEHLDLQPLLSHGLFRERFASLWTDGLRALALEAIGYNTQMVEFIETEHTPKNILIRAVMPKKAPTNYKERMAIAKSKVHEMLKAYHVKQQLITYFDEMNWMKDVEQR